MSQNQSTPISSPLTSDTTGQPHIVRNSLRESAKPPTQKASPDQNLVNQTRQQIRSLAAEVDGLAKSDCSEADFFEGFLTRITSAVASIGGAVWMLDDQQHPVTNPI